jgi:hypothetical protein
LKLRLCEKALRLSSEIKPLNRSKLSKRKLAPIARSLIKPETP